jgi:hypothetical protein
VLHTNPYGGGLSDSHILGIQILGQEVKENWEGGFMKRIAVIMCLLVAMPVMAVAVDIPVCPKCHSRDIVIDWPPPEPDREVPINEYYGYCKVVPAILIIRTANWKCNKCNETGEITY